MLYRINRDIPDVPFEQLTALVVFVQSGSMQEAARRMGVTQPAISSLLRRLEGKFSQPLFTMDGNRKILTSHGRALVDSLTDPLTHVLTSFDRFQRHYGTPENRLIRVAARTEILRRLAGHVEFAGSIEFMPLTGKDVVSALHNFQCDVGIVQHEELDPAFATRELFLSGVSLILPRSWLPDREQKTLNPREFLTTAYFQKHPFVAYRREHPFLQTLTQHLGETLEAPEPRRICSDWELVAMMVEQGQGFSVVPSEFAHPSKDRLSLDLSPTFHPYVPFRAILLRDFLHVPGIESFIRSLEQAFQIEPFHRHTTDQ